MNRELLAEQHSGILLRHSRALADTDGIPSALLLAELAAVADEHARQRAAAVHLSDRAIEQWIRQHPDAFAKWLDVHRSMVRIGTESDTDRISDQTTNTRRTRQRRPA